MRSLDIPLLFLCYLYIALFIPFIMVEAFYFRLCVWWPFGERFVGRIIATRETNVIYLNDKIASAIY
jgi:hypothetical protein